jgi:purine-binding chemotaxis protein CheW
MSETKQYLTFKLEDEVFAVDVANIREILDYIPATKVPGTPDFMRGVINVRGSVIPVMDMRLKFGLPKGEETVNTCIVVLEVDIENGKTVLGALADSVQEVFEMEDSAIEPPPKLGTRWKREFLKGIGKRNDALVIILDINKVFTTEEMTLIQEGLPQETQTAAA